MTYRLATSFIALSTALAGPALADVNAADVWSTSKHSMELVATLNGDISATS
jgi:hypothetical protein